MKVTNNKIGPNPAAVDTAKTGKTDASKGALNSDQAGAMAKNAAVSPSNVSVSERAQMMAKAKEIASKTTVDEAKVARLQKMIDEGKYKVDAQAVADRLVDEHLNIPD